MNFSGADLSRLDLRYINFKLADLSGCDLTKANLHSCSFERANLTEAKMDVSIFVGGRIIWRIHWPSIFRQGANLQGVKMLCCNAEGASMKGCNFDYPCGLKANMEGAFLAVEKQQIVKIPNRWISRWWLGEGISLFCGDANLFTPTFSDWLRTL